jgi:hypothetical protein
MYQSIRNIKHISRSALNHFCRYNLHYLKGIRFIGCARDPHTSCAVAVGFLSPSWLSAHPLPLNETTALEFPMGSTGKYRQVAPDENSM